MRYIWIYCLILLAAWQSAFATIRVVADSIQCGTVVAGGTVLVGKDILLEKLSLRFTDSIVQVGLYNREQDEIFEVIDWERNNNQQMDMLYLQARFTPRAVASYQTFIAIETPEDTLLLPIMGQGIALRTEPQELDFGVLYMANNDTQTQGIGIYNDGDVAVQVQIRLGSTRLPNPFSISPDNEIWEIPAREGIFIEVTCSTRGQVIKEIAETVRDSLAISVVKNGASQAQLVPLSAQFVSSAQEINSLDFGNVLVGTSRRLSISFTNWLGRAISIPRVEIQSKDDAFTYVDSVMLRDVLPGATVVVEIEFRPVAEGVVTTMFDLLVWLDSQNQVVVKTVQLSGNGFILDSPTVTTGIVRVQTNEIFQFPVTVRFDSEQIAFLRNSNVDVLQYEFAIQLNGSIADVFDEDRLAVSFDGADQRVQIGGSIPTVALQPVLSLDLQMRALLGDTDSSVVRGTIVRNDSSVSIVWSVPGTDFITGGPIESGAIVVTDVFVWPNGEKRLINTRKGGLVLELTPNPVSATGTVTIVAAGFGNTATLVIYSSLGAEVYKDVLNAATPVSKQVRDLSIGRGTYYCRLTSGSNSLVKLLRVE